MADATLAGGGGTEEELVRGGGGNEAVAPREGGTTGWPAPRGAVGAWKPYCVGVWDQAEPRRGAALGGGRGGSYAFDVLGRYAAAGVVDLLGAVAGTAGTVGTCGIGTGAGSDTTE